jgi:RNA polymerase sigma factor (TIGR02999 family)
VETAKTLQVTALLRAWGSGDRDALDRLVPHVYTELRRMSRRYMKAERPGHTIQATALVHDVYLKLVDLNSVDWKDRAHFYAVCAQIMRRILVDEARARQTTKRGGNEIRIDMEEAAMVTPERDAVTIALDDALTALEKFDARKARVTELRYFGGLSVEETAEVLKLSPESVMRDWKLSKAWLSRELGNGRPD